MAGWLVPVAAWLAPVAAWLAFGRGGPAGRDRASRKPRKPRILDRLLFCPAFPCRAALESVDPPTQQMGYIWYHRKSGRRDPKKQAETRCCVSNDAGATRAGHNAQICLYFANI